MESCARFLPLQLKVASCRLRNDFQCNLAGAAEDTFAVRESRATFMSTARLLLVFDAVAARNGSSLRARGVRVNAEYCGSVMGKNFTGTNLSHPCEAHCREGESFAFRTSRILYFRKYKNVRATVESVRNFRNFLLLLTWKLARHYPVSVLFKTVDSVDFSSADWLVSWATSPFRKNGETHGTSVQFAILVKLFNTVFV